jgi:hypothetical protein
MSTRHKSARRRPPETRAREDDDQMLARWCNTGPLNVRGIVAYERCLRAIVMRVRRSDGEGPKSDRLHVERTFKKKTRLNIRPTRLYTGYWCSFVL